MKRFTSFVLAIVIAVSALSLPVLAVEEMIVNGFANDALVLDDRNVKSFGHLILGEQKNVLEIPIYWDQFTPKGANALKPDGINAEVMNNLKLTFSDEKTAELFGKSSASNYDGVHYYAWTKNKDAHIILIGKNIGDATGFINLTYDDHNGNVFSAKPIPIKGSFIDPTINKDILKVRDKQLGTSKTGIIYNSKTYYGKENLQEILNNVRPGDEIIFTLNSDLFDWDPDINNMLVTVRKATMDNNHITAIKRVTRGNELLDYVGIENIEGDGHVVVRFKENLNKSKAIDFDFEIGLAHFNVMQEPTVIRLQGTVEHEVFYANENNDYIYTGDGIIIEAEETVKNLVLEIGKGIFITTTIFEGQRYYIRATDEIGKDDRNLMTAYPNIKKVLTVYTDNVKPFGEEAMSFKFDRNYYVYDANGNLLGTSDQKLPYRNKLYFSLEELTIEEDFYETTGGLSPTDLETDLKNANDNPLTGGYSLEMQRILELR